MHKLTQALTLLLCKLPLIGSPDCCPGADLVDHPSYPYRLLQICVSAERPGSSKLVHLAFKPYLRLWHLQAPQHGHQVRGPWAGGLQAEEHSRCAPDVMLWGYTPWPQLFRMFLALSSVDLR